MAGDHQHPISDDASDNSDAEFNPAEDLVADENLPLEVEVVFDLSFNISEVSIPTLEFHLEPFALVDLSFNKEPYVFDGNTTYDAILSEHQNSSALPMFYPTSLLFSHINGASFNKQNFSTIYIDPVVERENIASIIQEIATINSSDKWFERFGLGLKSLQRIKDHEILTHGKLVNIPAEAVNLAAVLAARLSLSTEHAALVKEDLEKPVVDSINFLFSVGQITTATSSMKYQL